MYTDLAGVMIKFPYVASPNMLLVDAKKYMQECDIRHLPIVANDRIVGVLSERDIIRVEGTPSYPNKIIDDVMSHYPFVASHSESLATVLSIMIDKKYGSVLITNDSEQLVGIFTTIDALVLLKKLLTNDPKELLRNNNVILKEVVSWN